MSSAMNRLLWWHWLLVGFGASLILFLILFFAVIRPKTLDAAQALSDAKSTEDAGGTPDKVAAKQRELVLAKSNAVKTNQSWKTQSAVYMPPIDFSSDPLPDYSGLQNSGIYRLNGRAFGVKDLPALWGRWVTSWYASQWSQGITPETSFPVESFSSDPNDVSTLKSISFPQSKPWNVTVQAKNFDAAMNHLRRFNGMLHHGMAVVDKVAISGQSPDLQVSYTLQLFIIPPTTPPAPDPRISGSAAGAGRAPMMGGMGMGGSGGPSGGMGMGGSGGPPSGMSMGGGGGRPGATSGGGPPGGMSNPGAVGGRGKSGGN